MPHIQVVKTGDRWGALECLGAGYVKVPVMALDDRGREYEADYKRVIGYLLHCDCGKEWEIKATEFPGKRKMLDCGCGRGWVGRRVTMAFSTKPGIQEQVERWASDYQMTMSAVVNEALREYFERQGVWEERIKGVRPDETPDTPELHKGVGAGGVVVEVDPWEVRD